MFMQEEIDARERSLSEAMADLMFLRTFAEHVDMIPEMDHVSWLCTGRMGDGRYLTLSLRQDHQDSGLVRALARQLGCCFAKEAQGSAIRASAELIVGGVQIQLRVINYLPEWCHVETREEPLPEEEWIRVKRTTQVVCGRKGESDDDPQIIE